MTSGKTGMGNKKHGQSGRAGKSPKMRHAERREAEKNEIKAKPSNLKSVSVMDLIEED